MTYSPLAITRRHVLGDLYSRCEAVVNVPVYLNDVDGEMIGYIDEGLGHYADAFLFHIPEDLCKKLSTGHYTYSFDYDYSEDEAEKGRFRRIKLNSICLTGRPVAPPAGRQLKKQIAAPAEAEQ